MEYILLTLVIFLIIALIMVKGYMDDKKRQRRFAKWLRENPGVLPQRDGYRPEDMERMSHYLKAHEQEDFHIDAITWNDLGMDRVFQDMNYTYSAAGEEYLYYLLHTPMQEEEGLRVLEEQVTFFMEHTDQRVNYQMLFARIGKTGKHSIYEYLHYLELLGERSNQKHYLGILAVVLSPLVMLLSVEIGIMIVVGVLSGNIIAYFKIKKQIDPYLTSFAYIFRLMKNAEEMEKLSVPILQRQMQQLADCRKKMHKFKSGSYILMSPTRMNGSGNPLEALLDYLRMAFHLDLIKFNKMLSEVRKNKEVIDQMISIIGYVETVIAIGCYRVGKGDFCIPVFDTGEDGNQPSDTVADQGKEKELKIRTKSKTKIELINAYHPLIEEPVKNSICTQRGVLLTGSNASGKSTFLKTVAINALLAQTIHTCLAESYRGGLYRILSSMALRDDLEGGDSYYIVEIKSLKRILNNTTQEGNPVLCFVDEVLRGTNTVERIAASTQILKSLAGQEVICFAATHDIELTHLLESYYNNYHFEEDIIEGDIAFNYQLKNGRATTRNAIRLLGVMGYEQALIREAEAMAGRFLKQGVWSMEK